MIQVSRSFQHYRSALNNSNGSYSDRTVVAVVKHTDLKLCSLEIPGNHFYIHQRQRTGSFIWQIQKST